MDKIPGQGQTGGFLIPQGTPGTLSSVLATKNGLHFMSVVQGGFTNGKNRGSRITDISFVIPNHESKILFLITCSYTRKSA